MLGFLQLLGTFVANLFRSRRRLEVENLFLRHQLNIALRGAPHRLQLRGSDRALLVWMTWVWPSLLSLSRVVQPDTILRWHRAGFRAYWRWKSRGQPGRPRVSRELRELIQRISKENPLWGAPRIHGELLKLGFEIAESTVSKYMIWRRGPPSQTWRTFLRNHADGIAAIDLCVVPTLTFECLFAFLVLGHGRRQLLWFAVTRQPTAAWLAQQIVEAFPWGTAPSYLIRDNDGAYGQVFTGRRGQWEFGIARYPGRTHTWRTAFALHQAVSGPTTNRSQSKQIRRMRQGQAPRQLPIGPKMILARAALYSDDPDEWKRYSWRSPIITSRPTTGSVPRFFPLIFNHEAVAFRPQP
jgi:hypothetical protein